MYKEHYKRLDMCSCKKLICDYEEMEALLTSDVKFNCKDMDGRRLSALNNMNLQLSHNLKERKQSQERLLNDELKGREESLNKEIVGLKRHMEMEDTLYLKRVEEVNRIKELTLDCIDTWRRQRDRVMEIEYREMLSSEAREQAKNLAIKRGEKLNALQMEAAYECLQQLNDVHIEQKLYYEEKLDKRRQYALEVEDRAQREKLQMIEREKDIERMLERGLVLQKVIEGPYEGKLKLDNEERCSNENEFKIKGNDYEMLGNTMDLGATIFREIEHPHIGKGMDIQDREKRLLFSSNALMDSCPTLDLSDEKTHLEALEMSLPYAEIYAELRKEVLKESTIHKGGAHNMNHIINKDPCKDEELSEKFEKDRLNLDCEAVDVSEEIEKKTKNIEADIEKLQEIELVYNRPIYRK